MGTNSKSLLKKQDLRKIYLEKRTALPEETCAHYSSTLAAKFFVEINLTRVEFLHAYFPIPLKCEPDTRIIIDRLQNEYPGVSIVLPKMEPATYKLHHHIYRKGDPLVTNSWGIAEPKGGTVVNPEQFDIVIVPMLAYDQYGHRVGYGKGYYDRFLPACRPDCIKVGLSFFDPVDQIVDRASFDVRLNLVITPETTYRFSP